MIRAIAGSRRSIPLKTLDGMATRPTQDRIKETLFNVIQMEVPGSNFLDIAGADVEVLGKVDFFFHAVRYSVAEYPQLIAKPQQGQPCSESDLPFLRVFVIQA